MINFIVLFLHLLFATGIDEPEQAYRLDGMYSLYVKKVDSGWQINWISKVAEPGQVIVTKEDETLYTSEEGPTSILHQIDIPEVTEPSKVKFGYAGSEWNSFTLDPKPKMHKSTFKNVDSLYILGDVHGNYTETVQILQNANVIDENLHWTGGNSHLVFVGDVLDRGQDAIPLIWLVYELEQEARKAGGAVHMVLGNHEVMVMTGDLRYVLPKEKQISMMLQTPYNELFNPKTTLLGQWLATKPTVLKIDKVLFAHGGMITNYGNFNARALNDSARKFMQDPEFVKIKVDAYDSTLYNQALIEKHESFFYDPYGPLWYRGYVQYDTLEPYLDLIHKNFGTNIHVVGHTIIPHIESRYDGKLIATNLQYFGTEMLLLTRKKRKGYNRFVIDLDGNQTELAN
jgi:hypothetical protein